MENTSHSRPGSADAGHGSFQAYQLILEHILTYPAAYEIPLRTMYTINCTPTSRAGQTFSQQRQRENSIDSRASDSPTTPNFPFNDTAAQSLSSNLMAQMANLPSQPTSLPPTFITSFLRKCFAADLRFVDFPQGLTGLDYLKDLESRRRREVAAALERLEINRETIDSAENDLSVRYPGVLAWFRTLEEKERKIEALYTQLFVGLRRWVRKHATRRCRELSLTWFITDPHQRTLSDSFQQAQLRCYAQHPLPSHHLFSAYFQAHSHHPQEAARWFFQVHSSR